MTVLITGSSGFIGHRLAETWPDKTEQLYGLDYELHPSQYLEFAWCTDVESRLDLLLDVLEACKPDKIVHLAGASHIPDSFERPFATLRANTIGTMNLLEAVRLWRKKTDADPVVVIAGSGEEYGQGIDIEETAPARPRTVYAASKAAATVIAHGYAATFEMRVRVARLANVYGPGQRRKFIPTTVEKLLKRETVRLDYCGKMYRSWLYVDDACHGLALLLGLQKAGYVYNLPGFSATNGDIAKRIRMELRKAGHDIALSQLCPEGDPLGAPFVDMDGHAMRFKCDWMPSTDLIDGIAKTVAHCLKENHAKT